jgi:Replication protein
MEMFLLGKPRNTLRYMVFSERTCSDLKKGMISLEKSFNRLRRSKKWRAKVKGCITAVEVTVRPNGMWHPHLNVLAEGEYFPHEELVQMWIAATKGAGKMVYVHAADAGTVRELIKYVTKISDLVGNPVALDEFLTAVYKCRLVRTYGSFYRLKLDEEESPRKPKCPDCGSTAIIKLQLVIPQLVSMDLKGVLRVKEPPDALEKKLNAATAFTDSPPKSKPLVSGAAYRRMKKSWDKRGLDFDQRREEWKNAIARVETLTMPLIQGWGYSEWVNRQGAA